MSETTLLTSQLAAVIEALVLASPEPLPLRRILPVIEGATPSRVTEAIASLNNRYMETGAAFRIREIAGGYQFYILPEYVGYVEELFTRRRKMRLTRAALETVAIVAYKQPVSKAEIEHIRGVASDGVLQNLLEKNMIAITGRAATVGKPLQYGTTDEFLKFFGLASLEALPKMAEIEELLAAAQAQAQTELELAGESPELREARRQMADEAVSIAPQSDEIELPQDPAGLAESARQVVGRRLTLIAPPQDDTLTIGNSDSTMETVGTGESDGPAEEE